MVVVSRQTIDIELINSGFTPYKVCYFHSVTGYVTEDIFRSWIEAILIPYVNEQRIKYKLYMQRALLIMDNCTSHNNDETNLLLNECGIDVFYLVPHSSDQIQQLDLGIFGILKTVQACIYPDSSFSTQTKQLLCCLLISRFQHHQI